MSLIVPVPREILKFWWEQSARPRRAGSHRTAILAAHPASSGAPATARCRSGRRNPAAITSAPASVTDNGITVRPARVSAITPASPASSMVPPTAVTTEAATTRGKALPGRLVAPAPHSPRAATTSMTISPARTATRAWTQP